MAVGTAARAGPSSPKAAQADREAEALHHGRSGQSQHIAVLTFYTNHAKGVQSSRCSQMYGIRQGFTLAKRLVQLSYN